MFSSGWAKDVERRAFIEEDQQLVAQDAAGFADPALLAASNRFTLVQNKTYGSPLPVIPPATVSDPRITPQPASRET